MIKEFFIAFVCLFATTCGASAQFKDSKTRQWHEMNAKEDRDRKRNIENTRSTWKLESTPEDAEERRERDARWEATKERMRENRNEKIAKWLRRGDYYIDHENEELIVVRRNNKWGVYSLEGEELVPPEYDEIGTRRNFGVWMRSALVRRSVFWGLYDLRTKEMLVPPLFNKVDSHDFGRHGRDFVGVQDWGDSGSWRVFSTKTGAVITPERYERVVSYRGHAAVRRNGKWGFLDSSGRQVIPLMYENIYIGSEVPIDFKDPVPVKLNGKWGFIDAQNKVLILFKYRAVYSPGPENAKVITGKGKLRVLDVRNNKLSKK